MSRKSKFRPVPLTCPGCGKAAGIQSYMTALPGHPALIRAAKTCFGCRLEQEARSVQEHAWDWAAALLKETRMHVQKTHDGTWTGQMTPTGIRALLTAQQGRCCCTGQLLWIPCDCCDPIPRHATLTGFCEQHPVGQDNESRLPRLVRAVMADPEWAPGNICLIARLWEAPYYQLGGAAELVRFMRTQEVPRIPTEGLLRHIGIESREQQVQEWIKYRTEQAKEQNDYQ